MFIPTPIWNRGGIADPLNVHDGCFGVELRKLEFGRATCTSPRHASSRSADEYVPARAAGRRSATADRGSCRDDSCWTRSGSRRKCLHSWPVNWADSTRRCNTSLMEVLMKKQAALSLRSKLRSPADHRCCIALLDGRSGRLSRIDLPARMRPSLRESLQPLGAMVPRMWWYATLPPRAICAATCRPQRFISRSTVPRAAAVPSRANCCH